MGFPAVETFSKAKNFKEKGSQADSPIFFVTAGRPCTGAVYVWVLAVKAARVYCDVVAPVKRRSGGRKPARSNKGSFWFLFWIAFIIFMCILFTLNLNKIKDTLSQSGFIDRFFRQGTESSETGDDDAPQEAPAFRRGAEEDGGDNSGSPSSGEKPAARAAPAEKPAADGKKAATEKPAEKPAAKKETGKSVSRDVYLIRVDSDGAIVPAKVRRALPADDSPLKDAIEAAIKGPTEEESGKKDLRSLIPPASKILSATVRGSTAYINFNEDFMFNTYGIEGYAAQLRQVVWTATEFSNVEDVQILIDGKRIDYLGEGIWIGSPLNRNNLE